MSNRIYYKKFKEALLGNKDERQVGEFWIIKTSNGIMVVGEKAHKAFKESKSTEDFRPFVKQIKKDKKELENFIPEPISDKDLEFIE